MLLVTGLFRTVDWQGGWQAIGSEAEVGAHVGRMRSGPKRADPVGCEFADPLAPPGRPCSDVLIGVVVDVELFAIESVDGLERFAEVDGREASILGSSQLKQSGFAVPSGDCWSAHRRAS